MKRWDTAIIALGLLAAVIGCLIADTAEGRFITLMTTIAAVLRGLGLNHPITRAPKLVVSYCNPDADDRQVVWNSPRIKMIRHNPRTIASNLNGA